MFHDVDPTLFVRELLADLGLSAGIVSWLSTVAMIFIVGLIAWLSKIIAQAVLIRVVTVWVKRTKSINDDKFLESRMFHRLSWIVPGVVVWFMASWALKENLFWLVFVHKAAEIYIVVCIILTVIAFIEGWYSIYQMKPISEGRSIKGYVQLVETLIGFTGILIIISILFRIQMTNVVAGLGAATAVLAIVFRDTILGLVASVQLSQNRMLNLGDWITIPGRHIDGTVTDISLHTVKVENFDKTILTVPTYSLVSESFQNWKGMEKAGVRRIKRDIRIDVRSICFLNAELVSLLSKRPLMEPYLEENSVEIEKIIKGETTILTNLGAFRAYMTEYLRNHEHIDTELPIMVRDMPPSETGMPVELYCFSRINQWVPYEAVQSGIFDYVYAVVPQFGLRTFQNPTGSDIESLKK